MRFELTLNEDHKMSKKRSDIAEQKAERLVTQTLGHPLYSLGLDPSSNSYEEEVKIFKLLYDQEDADYKLALWNNLFVFFRPEKPRKEDFTEEEYAFIQRWIEARRNSYYADETNTNKPFTTKRLRLRATIGTPDTDLYSKHLKEDGDFVLFTNLKCTKENIRRFGFDRPFFFVIEEKDSGAMIGYVGLRWEKNNGKQTKVMECEYYIFKPYRHRGYAAEALSALCNRAFLGKLVELEETNYKYTYKKRKAKPVLIRAMIREDNVGSCALVEACGFECTGTLHRHFLVEDKYTVNCKIYELTK